MPFGGTKEYLRKKRTFTEENILNRLFELEKIDTLLYFVRHNLIFNSVQFSSVTQSCPTLCDPMNHSMPSLPVHHQLPESIKLMPIESVIPSSHLILFRLLLLQPPIPPSIRVFSKESALHSARQRIGVSASTSVPPMSTQD